MQFLQGSSVHRLKDAKTLLVATEPQVLVALAQWRETVHYSHANSLPQHYFLAHPEWNGLRGKTIRVDQETHSLQMLVGGQVMRRVVEGEIIKKGEVPKLKETMLNAGIFKEVCAVAAQATKYKQVLGDRYAAMWASVPSA